ncbi:MAG TPA: arylamine N-acetyltransferase [Terriglobales bacterium]|nr:arylamine N-acetyltransferase [Terriglobales bacterium]
MLDVSAYLKRVGYTGPREPSSQMLIALHRAHMLAVPFENLDIHIRRPIVCDLSCFLHKIITEHRGGFCYELNGAFAALLRALGFEVTLLSARVARADGTEAPEFDHLTLRVEIPGRQEDGLWLADVGFGDSFLEPLRLKPELEQPQIGRVYRLSETAGRFAMEVLLPDPSAEWKRQYSFSLGPRRLEEFAAMCAYQQTSPESHFTRQRICSRATERGRVTLSDFRLIVTSNGQRVERMLASEAEWRSTLKNMFEIELPA